MKFLSLILLLISTFSNAAAAQKDSLTLVDFKSYPLSSSATKHSTIQRSKTSKHNVILTTSDSGKYPGISFPHPDGLLGRWDLSAYEYIAFQVTNTDTKTLTLHFRIDNPQGIIPRKEPWITDKASIPAGKTLVYKMPLRRKPDRGPDLFGMDRYPQGLDPEGISPSKISNLVIFLNHPSRPYQFEIGPIIAAGNYQPAAWESMSDEEFFPFIDQFGQFKYDTWANKILLKKDLDAQRLHEKNEIVKTPRPKDWDKYGGWANGPRLKATGYFRTEKYKGKWWFVDPDGYLFWSHGITTVKTKSGDTIISGRENYFEQLPDKGKIANNHYKTLPSHTVTRGKFKGQKELVSFNFLQANYAKKYGKNWKKKTLNLAHDRLSSWGMNTFGLWSDPAITSQKRTPYVDWIYYSSPKIKGKAGHWHKQPDMWDPAFETALEHTKSKLQSLKGDPWLLGIFVDNEIYWQDAASFTANILSAPSKQAAKIKLIEFLTKKYTTVNQLNKRWKSAYGSWSALSNEHTIKIYPDAIKDAKKFYRLSTDKYYKTIRDFIKNNNPDMLYLGSRLNGDFPIPSRSAANYCDVVSFNLYRGAIDDFSIVGDIDKPVIVGEWHFGATDRGVFGSGLVSAENQEDRANKYRDYVTGALTNPYIVGTHWFQYFDEMTTGRALDQENHQIGFVSITDTPYTETIEASRSVGYNLYTLRSD